MRRHRVPARVPAVPALLALALLTGAWGLPGGPARASEAEGAAAAPSAPPTVEGRYAVTGVTTEIATGTHRPIRGWLTVRVEGDRYVTHFELTTVAPGHEAVDAVVVGSGEGSVSGEELEGEADTQILAAPIPGMDVDFPFLPRELGVRLVSSSRARIFPDGSLQAEIENRPAEGETYSPTRTLLVGHRTEARPEPPPE